MCRIGYHCTMGLLPNFHTLCIILFDYQSHILFTCPYKSREVMSYRLLLLIILVRNDLFCCSSISRIWSIKQLGFSFMFLRYNVGVALCWGWTNSSQVMCMLPLHQQGIWKLHCTTECGWKMNQYKPWTKYRKTIQQILKGGVLYSVTFKQYNIRWILFNLG